MHNEHNNNTTIGLLIGFIVGIIKNPLLYKGELLTHLIEVSLMTIYTASLGFLVTFIFNKVITKIFKKNG